MIQGYCVVAAVDDAHQIIVEAQAHGTGSEQELLFPVVKATAALRTDQTLIIADAGYHSETNLKALAEENIPALIADNGVRERDERFKDQEKYKSPFRPILRQGASEEERQDLSTKRVHLRPGHRNLPLPGGQEALSERLELHPQLLHFNQVLGHPTRLRAL